MAIVDGDVVEVDVIEEGELKWTTVWSRGARSGRRCGQAMGLDSVYG